MFPGASIIRRMIAFEEMDSRLESLGKDRTWLSVASGRKPDSIRVALAPSAPKAKRSTLIQKALSDAIEREESRLAALKSNPPFPQQHLVLRPSDEDYESWCRAADGEPVNLWAVEALNQAARRYIAGPVAVPSEELEKGA